LYRVWHDIIVTDVREKTTRVPIERDRASRLCFLARAEDDRAASAGVMLNSAACTCFRDVATRHKRDDRHVFTISWSSGGLAAYAISSAEKTPITATCVNKSVFKPDCLIGG
jgi:hypothetical protein